MSRRSETTTKVFVGSLPPGTTPDQLRELFTSYGEIAECDVVNRCGFLHLEDETLAMKAIDDLNNTTFNGTRISVEKGRSKPPFRNGAGVGRGGGGPMGGGRGGPRNGFGGPMRGGRDAYRGSPYMRDGGDYDRRGPPRGPGPYNGGGMDRGYDRGYGSRGMPPRSMGDGFSNGGERRPYMDDRSGYGDGGYGDSGYGMNSGGGDQGFGGDFPPMYGEDRPRGGGGYERKPMMGERRPPMMGPPGGAPGGGMPLMGGSGYDRRPPGADMFSRRDALPKPMGAGYSEPSRNAGYDSGYPPMPPRGLPGGPGPHREMPPVRRF